VAEGTGFKFTKIRIGYNPEQDRIVVSFVTTEGTRHRMWMTRRLIQGLWPGWVKALPAASPARAKVAAPWLNEVIAFEHEAALQRGGLKPGPLEPIASEVAQPLPGVMGNPRPAAPQPAAEPEAPAARTPEPAPPPQGAEKGAPESFERTLNHLVSQVGLKVNPGRPARITILTADGERLWFTMGLDNMHVFAEGLRRVSERVGWRLDLKMPWEGVQPTVPLARV